MLEHASTLTFFLLSSNTLLNLSIHPNDIWVISTLGFFFFLLWAIFNYAAMNMCASFWVNTCFHFSCLYVPRNGIAESYGNSMFNVLRNCQECFPRQLHHVIFPLEVFVCSNSSTQPAAFIILSFYYWHPGGYKVDPLASRFLYFCLPFWTFHSTFNNYLFICTNYFYCFSFLVLLSIVLEIPGLWVLLFYSLIKFQWKQNREYLV